MAILHLFNHALMKGALFLALGAVAYRLGSVGIRDFAGLGRLIPWTMAAIVAGGLSLIGVPPTAGFISKWYLVLATLEQGLWPVALLVLLAKEMRKLLMRSENYYYSRKGRTSADGSNTGQVDKSG